jgi:hypothetical protein
MERSRFNLSTPFACLSAPLCQRGQGGFARRTRLQKPATAPSDLGSAAASKMPSAWRTAIPAWPTDSSKVVRDSTSCPLALSAVTIAGSNLASSLSVSEGVGKQTLERHRSTHALRYRQGFEPPADRAERQSVDDERAGWKSPSSRPRRWPIAPSAGRAASRTAPLRSRWRHRWRPKISVSPRSAFTRPCLPAPPGAVDERRRSRHCS